MRVCTFKSGAKVRSFSGRNDEISVVNARNPIFYSKIADSIAFVTTRIMGRYALSYGPLWEVVNAEACSARHTCLLATAVIQRRTQQRRLLALTNTTARSHQHDCSLSPTRLFALTNPTARIALHDCSLLPTRLFALANTTARIALLGHSNPPARLFVLAHSSSRKHQFIQIKPSIHQDKTGGPPR